MAAGLVTHNITTAASGGTFTVVSWVPDTAAPNVGAVPVAMLTDGTRVALVSATGNLMVDGSNAPPITVLQGATNGGIWQIEGKTGGTGVLVPVHIDSTQLGALIASAVPVISGGYDWLWIAANQTTPVTLPSTVLGSYLEHLMCMVTTPATSQVQIKDGTDTAREILPDNVAGGIGTYVLPIGVTSKVGAWQVLTHAGVTVIATFKAS